MDAAVSQLAAALLAKLDELPPNRRYLVGLSGIPGAGKSVLARAVVLAVNAQARAARKARRRRDDNDDAAASGVPTASRGSNAHDDDGEADVAIVVGLDGWHLSRAQLDQMPDPQLARDKRGAEWTFDAASYADFVEALAEPIASPSSEEGEEGQRGTEATTRTRTKTLRGDGLWKVDASGTLWAPSFSHSVKDPVPYDIPIRHTHRLILIEGLYATLDASATGPQAAQAQAQAQSQGQGQGQPQPHWTRAASTLNERWFLPLDRAHARTRLIARHVATGVAPDAAEAARRADGSDLPNGDLVRTHLLPPVRVLDSVTLPDQAWAAAQEGS